MARPGAVAHQPDEFIFEMGLYSSTFERGSRISDAMLWIVSRPMQLPLTWLQLLVLTGSILVPQRAMMIRGWAPNEENLKEKVNSQDEVC